MHTINPGWRIAALWLALLPTALAQRVDMARSELSFVTRLMGVPVEGRFTHWDAALAFDPRQPETGQATLRIELAGVRFAAPEVTAEAQRAVWLDSARFPQASFQSTAIKALGGGRYEMAGRLSLKGQTRELVVPISLVQSGVEGVASGSFAVNRLAFRIGEGEWADASLVAPDVQVRFKLTLTGLSAQ
jgi:polyisoprenoid-binding protein YceI